MLELENESWRNEVLQEFNKMIDFNYPYAVTVVAIEKNIPGELTDCINAGKNV